MYSGLLLPADFELYITDSFNAMLLLWFCLFKVLVSNFVLFELYVRFHSFSKVQVTEWPPIGK